MASATELRKALSLTPNPEGGFFSECFKDDTVILRKESLPDRYKVDRAVSTAIYYLLSTGCVSRLHRIPSAEVWHFYAGDPLTVNAEIFKSLCLRNECQVMEISDAGELKQTVLGPDVASGQKLQYAVPPMVWFGAFPTKDASIQQTSQQVVKQPSRDPEKQYSLVGCTVSPGFEFDDFEMGRREQLVSLFPHLGHVIEYLVPDNNEHSVRLLSVLGPVSKCKMLLREP